MRTQTDTVYRHIEEHMSICRRCSGTGKVNGEVCGQCEGSGRVLISSDVTTHIRPFVPEK